MFFFLYDCKKSKTRVMKGKSLFGSPDDYVVLDLETTALFLIHKYNYYIRRRLI